MQSSDIKSTTLSKTQARAQVGLIGLGVMGENLALNIERNGFPIAVFNRTTSKVDDFVKGRAAGKQVIGCHDDKSLVASLERPRKIVLLVKAGDAVDQTVAGMKPYLESGDIIIDGGNSHFKDTRRREKELKASGLFFIGSGVSGGEEGALNGPSLMPGGDPKAYEQIRPIWEAIAAKVSDGPCVTYLGPDGAGHFVKMVHNGIEYGDMQLIAEVYDVMRRGLQLSAAEISHIFQEWNKGILDSFLIEITAKVLSVIDENSGKPLVEEILDKAAKGTGKWTGEVALDLGIPIPTIDAALTGRLLSALKDERVAASKILKVTPTATPASIDKKRMLDALKEALYASKICSYAQGMALIKAGSDAYKWNINLAQTARIWKGGCIIRARLLEEIQRAFVKSQDNLLIDKEFSEYLIKAQESWRYAITQTQLLGLPIPALAASLSYFDSYRSSVLPQNLTQAQRDYFGAHTYELIDKPQLGFVHSDWQKLLSRSSTKTS